MKNKEVLMKKIHDCPCGCGQEHRMLPPGTWISEISGWHRVRITSYEGPEYSSEEIGASKDPDEAVIEAWIWWLERAERVLLGKCWECGDDPNWFEEWGYNQAPPCPVCGKEPPKLEEKDDGN